MNLFSMDTQRTHPPEHCSHTLIHGSASSQPEQSELELVRNFPMNPRHGSPAAVSVLYRCLLFFILQDKGFEVYVCLGPSDGLIHPVPPSIFHFIPTLLSHSSIRLLQIYFLLSLVSKFSILFLPHTSKHRATAISSTIQVMLGYPDPDSPSAQKEQHSLSCTNSLPHPNE